MSLAAGRSTPRPTGRRWSSASWAEWGGRSAAPGLVPRLGLARVLVAREAQQRHGVEGDAGDGVALVGQGGPGAPPTFSDIPDPALVGHAHVGQVDLVELG